MKVIFAVLAFLIPFSAAGEKTITSDAENYYAIGESDSSSVQLAKDDACNSARRELIGHIFGAAYQINQNMIRSLGVLEMSQDVAVNSGEVVIRGAITETFKHKETTKCTITYPVSEAKLEKERLKSANSKTIRFTEIGDSNSIKGGVLEIVTVPDEVEVLIDNVRWGVTPLRLHGKLTTGSHLLRLDDENYKVVEEKIEIGTTSKTRVDKILKRATGKLSIKTDPIRAKVKINGQDVSRSPISGLELLAGQKLKIEIEHPEAEAYSQSVQLKRDEEKTLNLKLPLKPAYLSLNTDPPTASITVDDSPAQTKKWIRVEPGSHTVKVEKKGFISASLTVDVVGGERKAVPTIKLASISERDRLRQEEAARKQKEDYELMMYQAKLKAEQDLKNETNERDAKAKALANMTENNRRLMFEPWTAGMSLDFLGPTYSGDIVDYTMRLCFHGGRRFFGRVALGVAWCTDTSSNKGSSSSSNTGGTQTTYEMGGGSAHISASFFVYDHWYIKPFFGSSSHSYSVTKTGVSTSEYTPRYTITQKSQGVYIGYEFSSDRWIFPLEVGVTQYGDAGAYKGVASGGVTFGVHYAF